jgi:hypothetical protein
VAVLVHWLVRMRVLMAEEPRDPHEPQAFLLVALNQRLSEKLPRELVHIHAGVGETLSLMRPDDPRAADRAGKAPQATSNRAAIGISNSASLMEETRKENPRARRPPGTRLFVAGDSF